MKKTFLNAELEKKNQKAFDVSSLSPDFIQNGLNDEEVEENRKKYGTNERVNKKKTNPFVMLLKDIFSTFNLILILLIAVSLFTDVIFAEKADYSTIIVLSVMVVLSGSLHFIEDYRSNKKASSLLNSIKNTAAIRRNGKTREILMEEAVKGDLVMLRSGDMVPADAYLLETKDFFVNQSSLTGESEPVEKKADRNSNPMSLANPQYVYQGSSVISGYGKAVIAATGASTMMGKLAKSVNKSKANVFNSDIKGISKILLILMAAMVPTVFLINYFTKNNALESIMYALSIAVGLTPEMLPLIVTSTLAKGSLRLGKKDVVVKELSAIENLGNIDVLCSDKTGTLTEDMLDFGSSYNAKGKKDNSALNFAFLNSSFQTGLRNQLDESIIIEGKKEKLLNLKNEYVKVDELPFDFHRRISTVVLKDRDGFIMISKGAAKEIINRSVKAADEVIDVKVKERILKEVAKAEKKGYKALAVAFKRVSNRKEFTMDDEKDMEFAGFITFADAVKKSASVNIQRLNELHVDVKVLTGDNEVVSSNVASRLNILKGRIITGSELENATAEEKKNLIENNSVFARLTPEDKRMIVSILKENGHKVGFMGDGINDAPALKEADVGISVDNGADFAKESADIILLKKDLSVIAEGIEEGRNTVLNMLKYIRITLASDFGNVFSVIFASIFLPFLPMRPVQLLLMNMVYDFACLAIPFDSNNKEMLAQPVVFNMKELLLQMSVFGPLSSVFDIVTYLLSYLVINPLVFKGNYGSLDASSQLAFASLFQSIWLVESTWTQFLAVLLLRSENNNLRKDHPSVSLLIAMLGGALILSSMPFTPLNKAFELTSLPLITLPIILSLVLGYVLLVMFFKQMLLKAKEASLKKKEQKESMVAVEKI